MRQTTKRTLAVASILAVTGLTLVGGVGAASAQSTDSDKGSVVDKIASTFNLNKDEVQKVFDQDRDERMTKMEARMDERLASAIEDGNLTQDQVDKIKAKRDDLKTFMDSLKDKTREERRSAIEDKRSELEQWAKDNNIPDKYAHILRGPSHGGRGFNGPHPEDTEN